MGVLLSLSPVLVLLLTALAFYPLRRLSRIWPYLPLVALALAFLLVLGASRMQDPAPFLTAGVLTPGELDLRLDFAPISVVFTGLLLLAFAGWTLAGNLEGRRGWRASTLVTIAGALAFLLADNWTTLVAAWIITDLGLFGWRLADHSDEQWRGRAWRGLFMGLFGILIALLGAVVLMSLGSSLRLGQSQANAWAFDLALVAAWIRAGLYPFHTFLRRAQDSATTTGSVLPRRGLHPSPTPRAESILRFDDDFPASALSFWLGIYLLLRVVGANHAAPAFAEWGWIVVLAALVLTTILALLSPEERAARAWSFQSIGISLLLIPLLPLIPAQPALVIWLGLGFWNLAVLLVAVRSFRPHTRRQPWLNVLWGAGILSAIGLPLTPAFMGRVGFYSAALQANQGFLLVLLPVLSTLVLVPLCRAFLDAEAAEDRKPTPREYAGLALLLVPIVVEGVLPFVFVGLLGRAAEDASAFAYDALLHPASAVEPIGILLAILLPLPIAFWLARTQPRWSVHLGPLVRLVPWLDTLTIGQAGVGIVDSVAVFLRQASALFEQHPIGWVLFAAIWVALWILNLRF